MSIKFQIPTTCVFVSVVLLSSCVGAAEGQFLFSTQETPRIQIESNKLVGIASGERVEIELSITDAGPESRLLISASIDGASVGDHSIDLERLPSIDLSSAAYFADPENSTIKVELRFSAERDCFVNDDGRDRLVVALRQGRDPQSSVVSYENCEPFTRALNTE